ncbi:uncharacterized protein TNCV_445091 [Trichonephila clavipes]|nr:uncharacterized protein TNCV_445091 [Trichonephila clavipes]
MRLIAILRSMESFLGTDLFPAQSDEKIPLPFMKGIIEKVTNPFISTNDPVLYFPHQVIIKNESLTTKQQIGCEASACERRVLKEEMGSEKSDEDMELSQATERFIPLESERAKMLNVGPDAMAQPVTVPEEKCLPRALLISADEMCEEKEERLVDVI